MTEPGPSSSPGEAPTSESAHVRLDAVIRGEVQGVGFRYFVHRRARAAGLTGWVANEGDGSVRCQAEGARVELEHLLSELRAGPPAALVERVDVLWGPATGSLPPFGIRSGAHRGD